MRTLLIVDDERIIREGIAGSLPWKEIGIGRVLTAKNGKEALELLEQQSVDVVITDIVMPELDGLALIAASRELAHAPAFIITSSYDDFKYAQTAIRYQVVDYLLKPINPIELRQLLKEVDQRLTQQEKAKEGTVTTKELEEIFPQATLQLVKQMIMYPRYAEHKALLGLTGERFRLALITPVEDTQLTQWQVVAHSHTDGLVVALSEQEFLLIFPDSPLSSLQPKLKAMLRQRPVAQAPAQAPRLVVSGAFPLGEGTTCYEQMVAVGRIADYYTDEMLLAEEFVLATTADEKTIANFYGQFQTALNHFDLPAAFAVLDDLFAFFKEEIIAYDTAVSIVTSLFFQLALESREEGLSQEVSSFHTALHFTSIGQLKEFSRAFLRNLFFTHKNEYLQGLSQSVVEMIRYTAAHLADETLSLKALGEDVLYMSPEYLGKVFHREYGMKFSDYLLAARMQQAMALVEQDSMLVYQVAEQVGYGGNPNYFTQVFRQYTGFTPTEYRKYKKHAEKSTTAE